MTPTNGPETALAELAQIKLAEHSVDDVLARVADMAKRTVPGASEVSVTLLRADQASTAAHTGDLALHLDEQQYKRGRGPCLDAAVAGETIVISDMTSEARWPDYVPRAVECGALSSVSVGLPIQQADTSAMNIYATRPHAFDPEAVALAQTFAGYAAVALANAHLYASTASLAEQMGQAMASRAVIEQAKGIVMALQRCSADEAFTLLTRQSQHANRKLRDIASDVVERTINR